MKPFTDDETKLEPKDLKWLAIAGGLVLVVIGSIFGLGYAMGQRKVAAIATKAENAANVAKGEADALKAQFKAKDIEATAATKAVEDSDKVASALRSRLAKAKADLDAANGAKLPVALVVAVPDASGHPVIVLDGIKDELISAQEAQIKTRDALIGSLRQTITLRDLALDAKDRENLNLRASNAAKDGLIKGALLKGRFQGFVVGFGSGYGTGRAQR